MRASFFVGGRAIFRSVVRHLSQERPQSGSLHLTEPPQSACSFDPHAVQNVFGSASTSDSSLLQRSCRITRSIPLTPVPSMSTSRSHRVATDFRPRWSATRCGCTFAFQWACAWVEEMLAARGIEVTYEMLCPPQSGSHERLMSLGHLGRSW